jgi:outer membrane lipoprotein-sorting protein
MLTAMILFLTLTALPANPVDSALANFRQLNSYQVTLRSGHGDSAEVIRYSYKKPGFVRMDFIKPHKGARLVYNPVSKTVRLRPFGFAKPLILTLSPDNSLVKSSHGHRVDASDLGSLLQDVQELQQHGKTKVEGETTVGRKASILISVKGDRDSVVNGVHGYRLWLDKTTLLPLKTMAYDHNGNLLEEVLMEDLKLNPELSDRFFQLVLEPREPD